MTFDDMMKKYNGEWQGENAVILYPDGYYWIIAKKVDGKVVVTRDGNRLMGVTVPLANVSAGKVELPKKRDKKPAADVDDLDL